MFNNVINSIKQSAPSKGARTFTFVDLFCGAGGLTEGFLLAGLDESFHLVAASDLNPMVKLTYEARFRGQLNRNFTFILKDIREDSFLTDLQSAVVQHTGKDNVDVVCGGPPCQGFSVFGPRRETDPRNNLPLHYLRAIEALCPRYFVMENVPGLVKMYGGLAVQRLQEAVAAMGPVKYNLYGPLHLNAADYGVPQLRERILFIGCREDMPAISHIPPILRPQEYVTVGDAIGDLAFLRPWESATAYRPDFPVFSEYQLASRRGRLFDKLNMENSYARLYNHEAARHTPDVLARFSVIEKGRGLESIPQELWDKHLHTKKKWCVRLDDKKPAYTVVTMPDDFVHPTLPRILTVRELARLQSFDDTFIFHGPRTTGGGGVGNKKRAVEVPQYSQVGNAVPPLMAKAIAEEILYALVSGQTRHPERATQAAQSSFLFTPDMIIAPLASQNGQHENTHADTTAVYQPVPQRS